RADLHIHTQASDGTASIPEILHHVETRTDLDVIAITDHDDARGAFLAREVHAQAPYHFELITGAEVTTLHGHLLALFIEDPVRSFRPLEETVAAIHRQGGLAVIPHPFSLLTRSIGRRTLERVMAIQDEAVHPDGIEIANPTSAGWDTGVRAEQLNRQRWRLAETGGSDAHFAEAVGAAYTLFPGHTTEALRAAIDARTTGGRTGRRVPLRAIGVPRLLTQQARGLSATPRAVLSGPTGRLAARLSARLSGRREP
ncbi:MAG: hypothetical protein IT565_14220, partial [Rhodospirillales bacterium]|nr:hypothetical protein [Rhodospirillales bacterium]